MAPSWPSAGAAVGLPFIDEHQVVVRAPAAAVWRALIASTARLTLPDGYLRFIAAEPGRASGTVPEIGATLPGFAVAAAEAERELVLTGRHRFSRYALTFTLTGHPAGTALTARSAAEFPGLSGRLYRLAVIGSGAHRLIVPRLLTTIRRRVES